ncbi:Gfo/Idh/MocA family protein [Sandarakinorhabdus oryzae]|uniref:Gfo/Idh/MocA family protein n=1 Tax=Sandarakinorhabdus oryzae TaxID=2675220 RepID=UPI0012E25C39|nr:Gfo/Idh/MocA family oxidoreductase [Sandarakinorhabdus oryzae]
MSAIRLGLVGLGKIARDQHLPAIAQTPGIDLVAVASRNAQAQGVANYPTIEAMLAEVRLDAVVLCQPPQARFAAGRAALLAGCHVFLEKPPGATLSEVEALAALAQEMGVTLFASWHSRAAAAVDAARDWLAAADIRAVHIAWKEDANVWHPGQTWLWEPGGFGVFDPGINALSILTAILPEPVRMLSADLDVPANCAAPIAARLQLATASGVPITAEFDFRQSGPPSWDIIADTARGRLVLAEGGNRLHLPNGPQPAEPEQEYPRLYARFVELVRAGASDVDVTPLRLVADAFLIARHHAVAAFNG